MKTLTFSIKGMTCSSCEILLERQLRKVSGVSKVSIDRSGENGVVECEENVTLSQLQQAVDPKYTLLAKGDVGKIKFITANTKRFAEIGGVLIVLFGLYLLFQKLELLPSNFSVSDNMSYGFVFVLGLLAATSTCLAVSGGLLLAISQKYNQNNPNLTSIQKFKPHLWFNIGRIVSYAVLGGLIGFIGSFLTISPQVTGIVTIIVSVLMVIMGFQLLQIFPWLNKLQVKMPKFIAQRIYDKENSTTVRKTTSFLFGAATFFLPCGFTQALQLYVLSKGDFVTGAAVMFLFSLGTLPALISVGALSSFAKGNLQRHFMTFSALLIIVLGIFNIPSGLNLTGATVTLPEESSAPVAAVDNNVQVIEMKVEGLDYVPSRFTITKGVPVEFLVDGRNAQGCARVLVISDLKVKEYLSSDSIKRIRFTPTKEGKISFTCSMGMAGPGVFEVVAP